MSSDIFSWNMDYSKFDLLYAGAQKNMGPAGTTLVVVKESILGKVSRSIPAMLDYRVHLDKDSMFNTPGVCGVHLLLNMRWVDQQGGIPAVEAQNRKKAELLYNEIDRNSAFEGFAAPEDRSIMNATFNLSDPDTAALFDPLWQRKWYQRTQRTSFRRRL